MSRKLLRFIIDWLAAFLAFTIVYISTDSILCGALGVIGIALYGCWCFWDGKKGNEQNAKYINISEKLMEFIDGLLK